MIGRPSTYDPSICERVIDLMAEGKSLAAVAREYKIARSTLYEWSYEHPELAEAIAIGRDLSLAYWEDLAHAVAKDGGGNASVLNFQMKNRFRSEYRDTQDHTIGGGEDPLQVHNKVVIEFIEPSHDD